MKVLAVFLVALAVSQAAPTVKNSLYSVNDVEDIVIILTKTTTEVLQQVETQTFVNTDAKADHLYKRLNEITSESQKGILTILSKYKTDKVKGFYITNRIVARGVPRAAYEELLTRDDISEIRAPKINHIGEVIEGQQERVLEWGVSQVNGPECWAAGFTGKGTVVSTIDTGVRYTHVALAGGYREAYGWFDPYLGTAMPNDQNGHGSHTMGSICGRNGTGVAPEAEWVACKGCDTSSCTEDALLGCAEWTFCPTLADGSAPNCTMRPNLSSNSWGGGQEDAWYDEVVNMWNSVNIIPVFAIGNSGPGCRTANSPGDRPNLISVGATNAMDAVTAFSSHGPSLTASRIKPEISAPGNNIRSCSHTTDTGYAILSGTSMATPHVAGAVALLIQQGKTTRAEIETAMHESAVRPSIDQIICNGGGVDPDFPWPNNSFGHGRLDAHGALGRP